MRALKTGLGMGLTLALSCGLSTDADATSASILRNTQTGNCAVPQSSGAGAAVIQAACSGVDDRLWRLEFFGGGNFRLRNAQTNLCLDLASVSPNNGIGIAQNACGSSSTQLWQLQTLATDRVLVNVYSGKCLDAGVGSTFIQQWACGSVANQRWTIVN